MISLIRNMMKLEMYGRGLGLRMAILFTCLMAFVLFGRRLEARLEAWEANMQFLWLQVTTKGLLQVLSGMKTFSVLLTTPTPQCWGS